MSENEVPDKWKDLPPDEQQRRMAASERARANPVFMAKAGNKEILDAGREIGQEVAAHNKSTPGKRLQKFLAEKAREEDRQQKILAVIDDALEPDTPLYLRVEGVKLIASFDSKEHELEMRQQERKEDRDRDDIIRSLASRLYRAQQIIASGNDGSGDSEPAGYLEAGGPESS